MTTMTNEQETHSINVRAVPVSLHRRAKAQAALADKPFNQWLVEAIEEKLGRDAHA